MNSLCSVLTATCTVYLPYTFAAPSQSIRGHRRKCHRPHEFSPNPDPDLQLQMHLHWRIGYSSNDKLYQPMQCRQAPGRRPAPLCTGTGTFSPLCTGTLALAQVSNRRFLKRRGHMQATTMATPPPPPSIPLLTGGKAQPIRWKRQPRLAGHSTGLQNPRLSVSGIESEFKVGCTGTALAQHWRIPYQSLAKDSALVVPSSSTASEWRVYEPFSAVRH